MPVYSFNIRRKEAFLSQAKVMSSIIRPTSVTLVGWIIIALGAFGVQGMVSSIVMLQNGTYDKQMEEAKKVPVIAEMLKDAPRPTVGLYLISLGVAAGQLVCGILMLKGKSVGRIGYVALSILGFAAGAIAVGTNAGWTILFMIPALVIQVVLIICAFLPSANRYYAAQGGADEVLELR